ncbi:hypothetical protein H8K90_00470 [Winogradskyella echinorum]|uniref:Lipoprotein n=1 Tax=Winogradskyella echinorum TaxID=538189 RepID=A0ABR6XWG8_9FLAO|nr:hypothetical protein [Winogradskyella echinorum]MBC3844839.1 hypothetical protein [Winogradskyella echinorum]MBC5749187.1 hypothetical protein [Winogradskyella echinorum]
MKKSSSLLLTVIFLITISCSLNKGKFTITNDSDFDIDSLSIIPDSKKKLIALKKGDIVNHSILMDEVKSDGRYYLSFKKSGTNQIVSQGFGYYTNGYQIEDVINIRILNDTILINGKFNNSY